MNSNLGPDTFRNNTIVIKQRINELNNEKVKRVKTKVGTFEKNIIPISKE